MADYSEPLARRRVTRDRDGIPIITQHKDATEKHSLDYEDVLASGATISSVTAEANGVTVDASAVGTGRSGNNTAVDLTITGTDGFVKMTLSTSDSQTLIRYVRFIGAPLADPNSDYYQWR